VQPTTIDYATPGPRPISAKRWAVGSLLTMALILVVCCQDGIEYFWHNTLPLIFAQHHALNFSKPAGTVVYEEDHAAATRLAGGHLIGPDWTTLSDAEHVLGYSMKWPECVSQQIMCDHTGGGQAVTIFQCDPNQYVFLHGRTAAGGKERLVYVGVRNLFCLRQQGPAELSPGFPQERQALGWMVFQPGALNASSAQLKSGSWGDRKFWINMPWPLRIYAGQGDPKDASHFVIPYRTPQGTFAIDGWLLPNDQLTFARRHAFPSDGPMP
jgi:hypothetical protein